MIDFVFKNWTSQKAPGRIFFKKILETAVKELKLNKDFSISVNLVGEKKIQKLNKKYRHKDKPTDVLSFPLNSIFHIPYSISQDFGDIFICLSIAKNEAKRENISIETKLAQLMVHGFLHLLGYEHESSEVSAKKMFRLETKILEQLKF